jgi:hypothetical protein
MQEHIFSNHLLHSPSPMPLPGAGGVPVWPSVFAILGLAIIALLRATSFSRVVRIVQSAVSRQVLQKFEREESNPFRFYSVLLLLLFIMNAGFLCYRINLIYGFVMVDSPGKLQFFFFSGIFLIAILLKIVINTALAAVSGNNRLFSEYILGSLCILEASGLLLFPLVIALQFTGFYPQLFIYAAVAVLFLSVVLRWYRGMVAALLEERVGILQIFSYFCALEILPVLVLAKFIIETF